MKLILSFLLSLSFISAFAQDITGKRIYGKSVTATTGELMSLSKNMVLQKPLVNNYSSRLFLPNRENLPQNPEAFNTPPLYKSGGSTGLSTVTQSTGLSFLGVTSAESTIFPPDGSGAAGKTQFLVFVNRKIRTFNKTTGTADGVLDIDPDVFFSSVMNSAGVGETTTTNYPNVRYDRLSERWFLTIADETSSGSGVTKPNRVLIAVSDSATITGSTVWTFSYFENAADNFSSLPSLGIDADAVYIGTVQTTLAGVYTGTNGYVINKASLYTGTPAGTAFPLVTSGTGAGPFAPLGVDNYDAANTGSSAVGYFIGVDNATFSTLMLRRVTNPGGVTPTISANISLTVPTTTFPNRVTHAGNTGGTNGNLASLDDRLYAAHIRNNRLWTAHSFRVNSSGVASTTAAARNSVRWYEINVPTSGSPTLIQSGTIFDNAATLAAAHQYWIPSIMVSGQGHAAIGFSAAGTPYNVNAGLTWRLSSATLGTMDPVTLYTSSSTAYNPPGDAGGANGRMWGQHSYTSLDPNDDMTMWTIQEYCSGTDEWGVGVVKIIAPPPVTPTTADPDTIAPGQASVNVTITGSSVSGSGFFDPGAGFLNRITASVSGGITVNSVTYVSPTEVTLNLNTTGATGSTFTVTITNPDGQSVTSSAPVISLPVELSSFTANVLQNKNVILSWQTETEKNNYGFDIERSSSSEIENLWQKIGFAEGFNNSSSPKNYSFTDNNLSYGKFAYRLKQVDTDGKFEYSKVINVDLGSPAKFELSQNYPNPFNPVTTIKYTIPGEEKVSIKIFDMLGSEVTTLLNEIKPAGEYQIDFNASQLSSGFYFYKITAGNFIQTKKMILAK